MDAPSSPLRRFVEIHGRIEAMEMELDTATWRAGPIEVWPIVKHVLSKQLMLALARNFEASGHLDGYSRSARRMRPSIRARLSKQPLSAEPPDLDRLRAATEGAAIFVGNGASLTRFGDVRVNRTLDAVRLTCADRGVPTVGLYVGLTEDALDPATLLPGRLASLDIALGAIAKTAYVPRLGVLRQRTTARALKAICEGIGVSSRSLSAFCETLVVRVLALRSLFDRNLATDARAFVMSNYASVYGWALCSLARSRGIPAIDVQHGIEGRYSGSYHWIGAPRTDWAITPDQHFCWTADDAANFEAGHPSRRAHVIGPTTIACGDWLAGAPDTDGTIEHARAALLRERDRLAELTGQLARPIALFTGQHPNDILAAVALSRHSEGSVLYRGHPARPEAGVDLVSDTDRAALAVDAATRAFLPSLLELADVHVTGYSATILEAASLGVGSVARNPFASLLEEDYPGLLASRGLRVADDDATLPDLVMEAAATRDARRTPAPTGIGDALRSAGVIGED